MEEYLVYILSPIFAALGFVVRFIWDFYINRRKRDLQEKIKLIEYRLQEFYYPIFFNLKREQIIWDKILKLHQKTIDNESININITINENENENKNTILSYPTQQEEQNSDFDSQKQNSEPDIQEEQNNEQEGTETHVQLIKALDKENLKIQFNLCLQYKLN